MKKSGSGDYKELFNYHLVVKSREIRDPHRALKVDDADLESKHMGYLSRLQNLRMRYDDRAHERFQVH